MAKHITVPVALGERSYSIHIGYDIIAELPELIPHLRDYSQVIIVTDSNVAPHWLAPVRTAIESADIACSAITLPAGETSKSFAQLESLLEELLRKKPDRQTLLIALGGGVVGDITGFAASILLRGINFVQIPTTLLSQIDSSVGGKTGINSAQGKNLIGSFHQPKAVIIDASSFHTLPTRERLAGYGEMVKYGCINNPEFFQWLEEHGPDVLAGEPNALMHAITTSCQAKAAIVAADEIEQGQRALLNLGHTFGHALEAELGYDDRLRHGEAVAIGIIMAFDLSIRLGLCPAHTLERITNHWQQCGLPVTPRIIDHNWQIEALLHHMRQDKKTVRNNMTFILAHNIGDTIIHRDVMDDDLRTLLADYC